MDKMLELQEVSYRYPNAEVKSLNQINLHVEQGKLIVVMGPTGAGKTTLSLCLNGLIPQLLGGDLTGSLAIAGRNIRDYRVQTLAQHIGLVLQDSETQIFGMTVAEDTAFGLRNFLVSPAAIEDRIKEALHWVGLQGHQNRNTTELSGGEKQRLAIAGILALQPQILVLDEPALELDPVGRAEIYQTIMDLRQEQNLTILLIEHSGEAIVDKADEVVVLSQGQILWHGTPHCLFRNIPRLSEFGIASLPVSRIGWAFSQKGWLTESAIPLDVPAAELMIRDILTKHGSGRFVHLSKQPPLVMERIANAPIVLEVSQLAFQYPNPGGNGLRDLNLAVRQGEFLALIGPNGAGKTTFAKHLNGLLQPTAGDVIVNGLNTRTCNTAGLAQMVGYVFQNPDHQIFAVSVEKELEYGLKNAGLPKTEIQARIDQALQWVRLESFRKVHPFTLSKGQRQLVALASILVLKPPILVIDEPTTGLDWTGVQRMMGLINDLNQNGTTIIMITHDMDLVARYARRVILMKNGLILQDGEPTEVLANFTTLQQAGIIPPQIVRLSKRLQDIGLTVPLIDEQELIAAILLATEGLPCS